MSTADYQRRWRASKGARTGVIGGVKTTCTALGSAFLSDHLSRLYDQHGDHYTHVDRDGATVDVLSWTARTATVVLSAEARLELIDDADYQAEFTEDPSYRAQAKRVIARLR